MTDIPRLRIRSINDLDPMTDGEYVLYWMTAFRRGHYNFSLQRAVEWARTLRKPLVILEALRCGYRWASDRLHRFVIEGMADNAEHFAKRDVLYYPYLEPRQGAGQGLLRQMACRAAVVVSDDYPCFFLPKMVPAAARHIACRFELVDSNGLLPMRAAEKVFLRAVDFRRFLQKTLLPHLAEMPARDPLTHNQRAKQPRLPDEITERWPVCRPADLLRQQRGFHDLPIDHSVVPAETVGGSRAANKALRDFLNRKLSQYDSDRNQPAKDATSGLSPYLHFGHLSVHQVFEDLTRSVGWTPDRVAAKATGSAQGWWGANADVEAFFEELITWRELGFNMCSQRTDYDQFESLPQWAQQTLAEHAKDRRPILYTSQQLEAGDTHDPLWNAAQVQLIREGRIHNYLRMLWGKKILEWTPSPRDALHVMIELNNKYALDGRDPNSYSGIFWVLGRYDRAWGPERPIFGKIRYMSSDNTARKFSVKDYIERYTKEDTRAVNGV